MIKNIYFYLFILFFLITFLSVCNTQDNEKQKENKLPNILLIVADDLGFSDSSPFGGEISTPSLQSLADDGILFSNFYTAPTCSPSV